MISILNKIRYPINRNKKFYISSLKYNHYQYYRFCSQKNNGQNKEQNIDDILSDKQRNLIKNYKVDQTWNSILGLQKNHNFQKQLIVKKKIYQKTTKQLREAILFEDLLKNQIKILIYDTKGKPFYQTVIITIATLISMVLLYYQIQKQMKGNRKLKLILQNQDEEGRSLIDFLYFLYGITIIMIFIKHAKLGKRYVQKVIYDTEKEEFIITKRNILGMKREHNISRYKIVYTQSEFLNKRGTNYFDLDTKREFSIIYKYAWIKQDLFSHLIAQRIKI